MEYADRMGGRLHQREDPSVEQLSGLRHLLLHDQVPYCDFAVWGPDGRQQGKLLRFQAQVWVGGELITKMVKGQPNYGGWLSSWRVYKVAMILLSGVFWMWLLIKRLDFAGLENGLSTQTLRHLKKSTAKVDDRARGAVNAALGAVWHEVRTNSAFAVGELCVRCCEEAEDLAHILFRCPHWHKERRQVELPADDDGTPACVKLHGLLPAPRLPAVLTHEPALVYRAGAGTELSGLMDQDNIVVTLRRCGVGYYIGTQESLREEECQPHEVVTDTDSPGNQESSVTDSPGGISAGKTAEPVADLQARRTRRA
eukprot:6146927-Amphidinium_carterae.1